jgi:hypothetical protein
MNNFKQIQIGKVVSIKDQTGLGRIKVKLFGNSTVGGDDDYSDAEFIANQSIGWALPMIPKHLSVIPKVGEAVLVMVFDKTKTGVDRLYMGPIISSLNKLQYDEANFTATGGFSFGQMQATKPVTGLKTNDDVIPELLGVFPDPDDISIQGRFNTDITQKSNEIIIRAGKFKATPVTKTNPYTFSFNASTQGFIQIKNDFLISKENNTIGTVTNIVASKINLLTHAEGTPKIQLNQETLLSDEQINTIMGPVGEGGAHPLPFGDVLLEYLKMLKDAIINHIHNSNRPATDSSIAGSIKSMAAINAKAKNLEDTMLSKNIRIN